LSNYLAVTRYFLPFKDEEEWEPTYFHFGEDQPFGCETWRDVLSHWRVVILAEAGAGKTAEMREAAKRLTGEGTPAFYLTVSAVCSRSVRDALYSTDDQCRFDAWQSSDEVGIVFVDSVDEARLDGSYLRDALANLEKSLHKQLARVRIVLSCRISDWRSDQDASEFRAALGTPPNIADMKHPADLHPDDALLAPLRRERSVANEKEGHTTVARSEDFIPHIFALAPLTQKQVKQFAEWRQVDDAGAFLEAVVEADAADLANRPQDLITLISLWKSEKRIGTKYDALCRSITERLRETNPDREQTDTLSESKAYEGVKRLAAALTFSHKRFLVWPGAGNPNARDSIAVNPKDVLPDWSAQEQKTLLSRAVFDPANLGRVRFHHRSVQELLCAEWLNDLMQKGEPVRKVWNLLYTEKYGEKIVRPSMRPVASWLGQQSSEIGDRLLRMAPEVLVENGDPSRFSTESRARLLRQFCAAYADRDDADISIGIDQVARLSSPELAGVIRELWGKSSRSAEVRQLLLRMIWIGKVDACADIAFEAATNQSNTYENELGCLALGTLQSKRYLKSFLRHLKKYARSYPRRAIAPAIEAVYPSVASEEELGEVIKKHRSGATNSIHSGLCFGLNEIARHASIEKLPSLLLVLENFSKRRPWLKQTHHLRVSQSYFWVLSPIMQICARLISESSNGEVDNRVIEIARFAAFASEIHGDYEISESRKTLQTAVDTNRWVNRKLFWQAVEVSKERRGDAKTIQLLHEYGELWSIKAEDWPWLLEDVRRKVNENDRFIALQALARLWKTTGEANGALAEMQQAIGQETALQDELGNWTNPPRSKFTDHEKHWEKVRRAQTVKREARQNAIDESWKTFRDRLADNPQSLCQPGSFGDLHHLVQWLRMLHRRDRFGHADWQSLEPAFGRHVAEAAKAALIGFWRSYQPSISMARAHKVTHGIEVGLVGLAIEARECKTWLKNLTDEEVRLASTYALFEMNGLPQWAPQLWEAYPDVAKLLLKKELRWEFRHQSESGYHPFHVASALSYCDEPLRSMAADWSLDVLTRVDPIHDHTLDRVLRTISGSQTDYSDRLGCIAQRRLKANDMTESRRLVWLAVLFATDAENARDVLEKWLARLSRIRRTAILTGLLHALFDHRAYQFGVRLQSLRQLECLIWLVPLLYQYIRLEEDNVHEDGPYSPDGRDDAESARGALLSWLLDTPGEATYDALLEMSQQSQFSSISDRMRALAKRRAASDADLLPWKASDVVEFEDRGERRPHSLADLHDILVDRLSDIADALEHGDYSNKETVRQHDRKRADESVVQRELASRLDQASRSAYSIEREPEVADRKEPDIRGKYPGLNASVPIEIKVADSWTFAQLKAAVRDQLVALYMRPQDVTHGILVLTYHGKKKRWQIPGNRPSRALFETLTAELQRYANVLCTDRPNMQAISIVGIDLT